MAKRVVVVGSGFGGLGIACLMAKAGYEVEVYEKNESFGGRASVLRANGYTFDMGPSWYLMPDVFADFFALLGERVEDHLDLAKLQPSYRIFFKDKQTAIDLYSDIDKDAAAFEKIEPGSGEVLKEYLKRSAYQYDVAKKRFLYKNYDSILDFLNLETLIEGRKLSVFANMQAYVQSFFKSEMIQKIMQYTLVFLGSSPYNTPALYNIMSHIDFSMGVFYPRGGITKIVEALVRIATKHGARLRANAPVERILTTNGVATGIQLASGEVIQADIVISNADIHHTETALLSEKDRDHSESYWKKRTLAPSAFMMYLGIDGRIPGLTHHTLIFAQDWKKGFGEIFDTPMWPKDPSIYVCAPSVTDPTVAPEGKENVFILVPIAPNLSYSQADLESFGEKILETMEREMHIPNLRKRVEYKSYFCVKDFSERYNSFGGSALGLAHTLGQTAVFRPNNISKKVKNLYYVGADTNPGIGMPICLISAELAYKRVIQDRSSSHLSSM